ncbi:hypothetical protein [Mesorhizobium neociceri]|uniref:Uncharacterized protein n=1 Tax=Mesorhizobium neociceri TaxID=1307853 RepID=A0A838B8N2_9HYPH|nr:hypothetical protein [Mesorhizobium neociceri]MBA1143088.1 hypothetical protein [Mesorhizobium neociceri]
MGSLPLAIHWERLVLPTVRGFADAENLLQGYALSADDVELVRDTSYEVLRLGMAGAIFMYHFSEVALERDALAGKIPSGATKKDVWQLVANNAVAANGDPRPDDQKVLGEVADAIKHAELTSNQILHVAKKSRVIEISHDAPTLFPEGQPAGVPQVIIPTQSGSRSLRALFENVARAWHTILGLPVI